MSERLFWDDPLEIPEGTPLRERAKIIMDESLEHHPLKHDKFASASSREANKEILITASFCIFVLKPVLESLIEKLSETYEYRKETAILLSALVAITSILLLQNHRHKKYNDPNYSEEESSPRRDTPTIVKAIEELNNASQKAELLHTMRYDTHLSEEGPLRMDDLARVVVALHKANPTLLQKINKKDPTLLRELDTGLGGLNMQMQNTAKEIKKRASQLPKEDHLNFPTEQALKATQKAVTKLLTQSKKLTPAPPTSSFRDRVKPDPTGKGPDTNIPPRP